MTRSVFTQTLKEQRRALIGWSAGLAIVPMMYLPSYQSLKDQGSLNIKQNDMYTAMGMSDFASATGYLNSTIFSLMGLLLVVIFAVTMGARTAAQEDSGTLDLLLAQPISRGSLLRQRFAALAVQIVIVTAVLGLGVLAGAEAGALDVPAGNILAAVAGLGLLGLAVGALTLMVGAVTGKRAMTLGLAALLVAGGYLANSLGAFVDGATWLQRLSPFHYAVGDAPLVNGWNAGNLAVLLALAAAAIAVALTVFDRRDLAV
ncbi:ABC transporter permease subunit [Nocardia yamanashiensis]|uniref:ABC transporter permease subunit n=1 Tax=Nocardia yamanashiensis TaxID=209247 RepID=UPI001E5B15B1|nr:ABC transporter permease subunit [Nocardia yamanashiensis]UGT42724.1 ABC transporter permease subunit [Nocardia yamanashiensis]